MSTTIKGVVTSSSGASGGFSSRSSVNDWRTSETPSDLLFAVDTWHDFESFSGRAAIYESMGAAAPLNLDYVISRIDVNLDEHIQVSEHVGDTFGIICFGKAPLQVNFSGTLIDTQKTYGKQYLIDAYKNKLRLFAVSRTGLIPKVQFGNHCLCGPFISMRVTEQSQSEDTLVVILTMLVTQYIATDPNAEQIVFDYTHGVEEAANTGLSASIVNTSSQEVSERDNQVSNQKIDSLQPAAAKTDSVKPATQSSPPHSTPTQKAQAPAAKQQTPDYSQANRKFWQESTC